MKICTCNMCDEIFEDMNPSNSSIDYYYDVSIKPLIEIEEEEIIYWGCPNCRTDAYLVDNIHFNNIAL